jgi:hypothetical protein
MTKRSAAELALERTQQASISKSRQADSAKRKAETTAAAERRRARSNSTALIERVLDIIDEAAVVPSYEARYSLTTMGNSDPELSAYGEEVAKLLTEYLRGEGFRVEHKSSVSRPSGSDPMFTHTTYSEWLQISWGR